MPYRSTLCNHVHVKSVVFTNLKLELDDKTIMVFKFNTIMLSTNSTNIIGMLYKVYFAAGLTKKKLNKQRVKSFLKSTFSITDCRMISRKYFQVTANFMIFHNALLNDGFTKLFTRSSVMAFTVRFHLISWIIVLQRLIKQKNTQKTEFTFQFMHIP